MKNLITLLFIVLFSLSIFGQNKTATTEDGKKVILKPDKTWDFVKEVSSNTTEGDCSDYIQSRTDKMTGNSYSHIKEPLIISTDGKTGFKISLLESKGAIIFSITVVKSGFGCVDDDASIIILFDDNTRITLITNTKFNCKGDVTTYFKGVFGKEDQLRQLTEKKIQAIRVNSRNGLADQDFSETDAAKFQRSLICLLKSIK